MQIKPAIPPVRLTLRTSLAALALFSVAAAVAPATPAAAAPKPGPDLAIDFMRTDVLNPAVGEGFFTSFQVRNFGLGDSARVTVTVAVPAELRPDTPPDLGLGWTCSTGPSSWTCSRAALPAGDRAELFLPATVIGGIPGSHPAVTATIEPQRKETVTFNNTSSVTVEIAGICIIRGVVWHDLNSDGQRQLDEPPVAGGPAGVLNVSLFLKEGGGLGGGQATVDPDGTWSIEARTGTLYELRVEATNTYSFTRADVGDDATDSDIRSTFTEDPTLFGAAGEFRAEPDVTYVIDAGLVTRL
jgi:hypothetical protein